MIAYLLPLMLVALGGAVGAVARFWLSGVIARRVGETFPWGTLAINVSGAAAIGFLAGATLEWAQGPMQSLLLLALTTGILGSYTTVSSFSLQTLTLVRAGEWRGALWNIAASLTLCLAAVSAGFACGLVVGRG